MAREARPLQTVLPRITPQRIIFDVGLTCVVSTQLWHHIYCGGGLCELPVWAPPALESEIASEPVSAGPGESS